MNDKLLYPDLTFRPSDEIHRMSWWHCHPASFLRHAEPCPASDFPLECPIAITPVDCLTDALDCIFAFLFVGLVKGFLIERLHFLSIVNYLSKVEQQVAFTIATSLCENDVELERYQEFESVDLVNWSVREFALRRKRVHQKFHIKSLPPCDFARDTGITTLLIIFAVINYFFGMPMLSMLNKIRLLIMLLFYPYTKSWPNPLTLQPQIAFPSCRSLHTVCHVFLRVGKCFWFRVEPWLIRHLIFLLGNYEGLALVVDAEAWVNEVAPHVRRFEAAQRPEIPAPTTTTFFVILKLRVTMSLSILKTILE